MIRVLIVDDDRPTREVLRVVLEMHGFEVLAARDGVEGVELALEEQPDVVVSDLHMPRLDGEEAVRRLRLTSACPVIAITGERMPPARRARIESLFTSILRKPVAPRDLIGAIDHALDKAGVG